MNYSHFRIVAALAALTASVTTFAQEEDPTAWKTTAGLNFALTDGNSETLLLGVDAKTIKKWDKNEFTANAFVAYGESTTLNVVNGVVVKTEETTAQNYGGALQYNRLFTPRFYGYVNASGYADEIADIDYRFVVSPGVGYYFIKNERTTLSGEIGPGVVFEKVGGVTADYFTIRFAEKFTHSFTKTSRIFQDVEFLPQIDDWDNYVVQGQIGVEADITRKLALRVIFQDIYRSRPALIAGTNPAVFRENNDLRLLAGVQYKF